MNWYVVAAALIPLCYLAWIYGNPLGAARVAARLKRRFRQYLIHKHGKAQAEILFQEMRTKFGKDGSDPELIEEYIDANRDDIIHRLGRQYADAFLGRATWLEQIF
jgi:hypothetical protein